MNEPGHGNGTNFGRRSLLRGAGALGLGAFGLTKTATAASSAADDEARALVLERLFASSCTLTPTNIEGPFYLDLNLVRKDITEGKPGLPLTFYFRVLNASDCSPMEGAVVDVWHCDHNGDYSGFVVKGTQGETWHRGIQITDSSGVVCFESTYPGWYPGRTAHIHVKINPNQQTELTTQLYFEDRASELIYDLADYSVNGQNPTNNDTDGFFLEDLRASIARDPSDSSKIISGFTFCVG